MGVLNPFSLLGYGAGAIRGQVRNSTSLTNLLGGKHSLTRKYLVSLLFLFFGLACHAVFRITGAEIATNGKLVELLPLLPIGYLLYTLSITVGLVIKIRCS